MTQAVIQYWGGWSLERDCHLRTDRPVGIRPLFVRLEDHMTGLTHLLTLALRLLTLIETQVRQKLDHGGEEVVGWYEGAPKRSTNRPTGRRLLKAFVWGEITLTQVDLDGRHGWHSTPLASLLERILEYLGLSASIYKRVENSP